MAICLQGVNYNAVAAIGKSRELFKWTIIKRVVGLCLIVLGFWAFKIEGLLWGMVGGSYIIYLMNGYLVSKYVGYRLSTQFRDLIPIILIALLSAFIVFFLDYMEICWLFKMLLTIFVYVFVYLLLSYLCRIKPLEAVRTTMSLMTKRFRK